MFYYSPILKGNELSLVSRISYSGKGILKINSTQELRPHSASLNQFQQIASV